MQRKHLIGKRGLCLAVLAVLLFAGLLMAACLLDDSGNGEGQGTLLAPLGEKPKDVPPVANNPPTGQPVVGNPSAETPAIDNPPTGQPVVENPPEGEGPPPVIIPTYALGSYPGLDTETELLVKQAWIDWWVVGIGATHLTKWYTWKNVRFNYYFGNYDGCVVVAIPHPQLGMAVGGDTVRLGNRVFFFSEPNFPVVWKDGRLYDIRQAYKYGILTEDMVNDMYEQRDADYDYWFSSGKIAFNRISLPLNPNEKTFQIIRRIRNGELAFDPLDPDYIPIDPQDLEESRIIIKPWGRDYDENLWPENGFSLNN